MKITPTGRIKRLASIVIVVTLCLTGSGMGLAAQSYQQRSANNHQLDDAVNMIQQQTGGRVLRVRESNSSYVIKVLMPSGVIKTYRVDANQAQGSGQSPDDRGERQQRYKKNYQERR